MYKFINALRLKEEATLSRKNEGEKKALSGATHTPLQVTILIDLWQEGQYLFRLRRLPEGTSFKSKIPKHPGQNHANYHWFLSTSIPASNRPCPASHHGVIPTPVPLLPKSYLQNFHLYCLKKPNKQK